MPLGIGTLLNHRYRLERVLGQGGFGAVYLATDQDLGLPCAVKENLNTSAQAERQFRREATLLASLRHPNLPRVTDHFILAGQQYLVMDYIEGDDLKQRLEQAGPLPEAEVLRWALQLCAALSYLHALTPPVIHRDIKPANIKITPAGDAVLVDFGIAKASAVGQTTTGAAALTSGYAPPEQYGAGHTDARSDQYALAATLYHLLTGQPPPDSVERLIGQARLAPPERLRPGLSPRVAATLSHALNLAPERRFDRLEDMARALRGEIAVAAAADTAPADVPATQPVPAHRRRRWTVALWLGGGAVAALLGLALLNLKGAPTPVSAQITATEMPRATVTSGPPTATLQSPATAPPVTATATLTAAPSLTPAPTATPTRPVIARANASGLERVGGWGRGRLEYVRWSLDDQWLAVQTSRGATIFDPATLEVAAEFPGEQVLAFGPEGLAVLNSADGRARLLAWPTGETLRDLSEYEVVLAALSPDGRRLALNGRVTAASQWDGLGVLDLGADTLQVLDEGQRAGQPPSWVAAFSGLAFVPGGSVLKAGVVDLWNLATGRPLRQAPPEAGGSVGLVSPDGRWLAYSLSGRPARLTLEGLEKGGFVRQISLDGSPYLTAGEHRQTTYESVGMGFSADSQFMVVAYERRPYQVGTRTRGLEYWIVRYPVQGGPPEVSPGRLSFSENLPDEQRYYYYRSADFVFGPAGTRCTSHTLDNVLRVWDLNTGQELAAAEPDYLSGQMALSPGGDTLALAHTQGVDLVRVETGERVQTLRGFPDPFGNLGVTWLPQDVLLVERGDSVEFWDIGRGTLQRRITLADPQQFYADDRPASVVLSPDGRWFAHRAKYLTVYDMAAGQPRHTFGSANTPHAYAFTPDGQHLAVTSGQAVGLWSTETGQRDRNLAGHGAPTGALAFSPDGARLISASGDIWDMASGQLIAGFDWGAEAVAVSPDGKLAAGSDGRLVDMQTGETVGGLAGRRGRVLTLAFTPDGRRLVVQYADGVIDVFAVSP